MMLSPSRFLVSVVIMGLLGMVVGVGQCPGGPCGAALMPLRNPSPAIIVADFPSPTHTVTVSSCEDTANKLHPCCEAVKQKVIVFSSASVPSLAAPSNGCCEPGITIQRGCDDLPSSSRSSSSSSSSRSSSSSKSRHESSDDEDEESSGSKNSESSGSKKSESSRSRSSSSSSSSSSGSSKSRSSSSSSGSSLSSFSHSSDDHELKSLDSELSVLMSHDHEISSHESSSSSSNSKSKSSSSSSSSSHSSSKSSSHEEESSKESSRHHESSSSHESSDDHLPSLKQLQELAERLEKRVDQLEDKHEHTSDVTEHVDAAIARVVELTALVNNAESKGIRAEAELKEIALRNVEAIAQSRAEIKELAAQTRDLIVHSQANTLRLSDLESRVGGK